MRWDFELIRAFGSENGYPVVESDASGIGIDLGDGAVLEFRNAASENDSLVGFPDSPWHVHGTFFFDGQQGFYAEMTYLDVLLGLADGTILIAELRASGQLVQRWLVHSELNDVFRRMEPGEEIRVRRARPAGPG